MRIEASIFLQLFALTCSSITLASGNYDILLCLALSASCVADYLLITPFKSGGVWRRIICTLILLPSLFVLEEFVRRVSFLR